MVYCELILQLTEIVEAGEDENYIDSVDQWQISENLQDGNIEPQVVYPLITSQELPRCQYKDGSIYLIQHANLSTK